MCAPKNRRIIKIIDLNAGKKSPRQILDVPMRSQITGSTEHWPSEDPAGPLLFRNVRSTFDSHLAVTIQGSEKTRTHPDWYIHTLPIVIETRADPSPRQSDAAFTDPSIRHCRSAGRSEICVGETSQRFNLPTGPGSFSRRVINYPLRNQ